MFRIKTRHIQGFTPLETTYSNRRSLIGFTFIGVMMAVTIMALVGAMSIPVISTVRERVIEAKVKRNFGFLLAVFEGYWVANNTYPTSLQTLTTGPAPYIHDAYITGIDGYQYSVASADKYQFSLQAVPINSNSGYKTFSVNHTGEIQVLMDAVVNPDLPDGGGEKPDAL